MSGLNLEIAGETARLEGTHGVGVKSVDIMGNTESEGNVLARS